jgi:hypothetical protein
LCPAAPKESNERAAEEEPMLRISTGLLSPRARNSRRGGCDKSDLNDAEMPMNYLAHLDDAARRDFVSDLARFSEGVLTEKYIRKKFRLSDEAWEALGNDDTLVEQIEHEKLRRCRSGQSAREKAQVHFVEAPDIYAKILKDEHTSPRARLDAGRELRVVAANDEATPANAAEKFVININLGARTERYEKIITPRHDAAIDDASDEIPTPWGLIPAKPTDGGDGNTL